MFSSTEKHSHPEYINFLTLVCILNSETCTRERFFCSWWDYQGYSGLTTNWPVKLLLNGTTTRMASWLLSVCNTSRTSFIMTHAPYFPSDKYMIKNVMLWGVLRHGNGHIKHCICQQSQWGLLAERCPQSKFIVTSKSTCEMVSIFIYRIFINLLHSWDVNITVLG